MRLVPIAGLIWSYRYLKPRVPNWGELYDLYCSSYDVKLEHCPYCGADPSWTGRCVRCNATLPTPDPVERPTKWYTALTVLAYLNMAISLFNLVSSFFSGLMSFGNYGTSFVFILSFAISAVMASLPWQLAHALRQHDTPKAVKMCRVLCVFSCISFTIYSYYSDFGVFSYLLLAIAALPVALYFTAIPYLLRRPSQTV